MKHLKALLGVAIICVQVIFSYYADISKIFLIIVALGMGLILVTNKFDRILKYVIVFMAVVNVICGIKCYGETMYHHSASYNRQTGFVMTEAAYVYNTGLTNAILPMVLRDKIVYIDNNSLIDDFAYFFAQECKTSDIRINMNEVETLTNYVNMGKVSLNPDYFFDDRDFEIITQSESKPCIYMCTKNMASAREIVVFSDEYFNVYICALGEFHKELSW